MPWKTVSGRCIKNEGGQARAEAWRVQEWEEREACEGLGMSGLQRNSQKPGRATPQLHGLSPAGWSSQNILHGIQRVLGATSCMTAHEILRPCPRTALPNRGVRTEAHALLGSSVLCLGGCWWPRGDRPGSDLQGQPTSAEY